MKIHACWLDSQCRSLGVPANTYFKFWWGTVRISPPEHGYLKYWKPVVLMPPPK